MIKLKNLYATLTKDENLQRSFNDAIEKGIY